MPGMRHSYAAQQSHDSPFVGWVALGTSVCFDKVFISHFPFISPDFPPNVYTVYPSPDRSGVEEQGLGREAAERLIYNHEAVARFAARGAGAPAPAPPMPQQSTTDLNVCTLCLEIRLRSRCFEPILT